MKKSDNRKFPIKDIQFHEEGLREAASATMSVEEAIAVSWHSTAIAYLNYGAALDLAGPAAERIGVDGHLESWLIEDYLIPSTDSHGLTFFKHVFKESN